MRIGITHFAQDALGDIVYVSLPEVGETVSSGSTVGELESTKSVSDVYAPVSGEVVAVSPDLAQHPERVNAAPHEAWMIRLKLSKPDEASQLLSSEQYASLVT